MKDAYARAVRDELERLGATGVTLDHGGKHPRFRFVINGQQRFAVICGTPGSRFSLTKKLSELRRLYGTREPRQEPAVPQARQKPKRAQRDDAPMPDSFTARPDPFAVLAELAEKMRASGPQ